MKYADKIDARYSIVLGDNEIEQNTAKVKNMETGETAEVTLDGHFMEKFIEIQLSDELIRDAKRPIDRMIELGK